MAILQQITPSGLASSASKKNEGSSCPNPERSPPKFVQTTEFNVEEEKDEVLLTNGKEPSHNSHLKDLKGAIVLKD